MRPAMIPNDLPHIPYRIKVYVTYHSGIGHGPIKSWCYMHASMNSEGRQVLHTRGGYRVHPGVYTGDMTPIIPSKWVPIGTLVRPVKGEGEYRQQ